MKSKISKTDVQLAYFGKACKHYKKEEANLLWKSLILPLKKSLMLSLRMRVDESRQSRDLGYPLYLMLSQHNNVFVLHAIT